MSMSLKARQDLAVVIVLYLAAGFLYYKTLAMPASAARCRIPNIAMFYFCPSNLLTVSSTSLTYSSRVCTSVPLYYSISGAYCSDLILAWSSCIKSSLGF